MLELTSVMRPSLWLGYLFGQRAAILEIAKWRGSLWAGVALVMLTGIARNYDQTFITEMKCATGFEKVCRRFE
jgi:hypothetical protein